MGKFLKGVTVFGVDAPRDPIDFLHTGNLLFLEPTELDKHVARHVIFRITAVTFAEH